MPAARVRASASNSAGAGFSKRSTMLAPLTLTRLPDSSSTCAEASASDSTRPPRYLPASSNKTNMVRIVPCAAACAGRGRRQAGSMKADHLVQVLVLEIGQRVVAALDQLDAASRVAGRHLAPVEELVALGDDGEDLFRLRQRPEFERAQLVDVLGPEMEVLGRVVPGASARRCSSPGRAPDGPRGSAARRGSAPCRSGRWHRSRPAMNP